MKATFDTTVLATGNNTGIEVPPDVIAQLGSSKRPPVTVTIGDYSYPSTVAVMGGRSLIPLSKAHREASGLSGGDQVTVTLELAEGPREVDVPAELASALAAAGLAETFTGLSYSKRKEHARQVSEAKSDETRERRIAKVIDTLG